MNDDQQQALLDAKVESWRDRLLDLSNRNALINTRFSDRSSTIEFDTPSTEDIWQKLAAESEAGADPMRFPWRRYLVPPPPDWTEFEDEADGGSSRSKSGAVSPVTSKLPTDEATAGSRALAEGETLKRNEAQEPLNDAAPLEVSVEHNGDGSSTPTIRMRKRKEWNPSLDECRRSPHLQPNDLLVDKSDKVLDRKLRKLEGDARLAMSEQGVHAIYAVFGFLKWYESDSSSEERYSPLLLVPVTLSRDSASAAWELTEAEDDAIDNLCLRQRLWQDFKLELPPLPDINELEEVGARRTFLDSVRAAIEKHDRWEVVDKCTIGRFAFPKIAMWKDLGDHRQSVTSHVLCRALGGDDSAIGGGTFGPVGDVPTSRELDDTVPPGHVKTILDCDSSQFEAIVAARKGVSFVLDGPPGTGKSQTIANIIADALSVGRTVLFVSEKISALEVVKQRLEDRGLEDFCLECHSDKANRRAVLFELERCLDLPAEVYPDTSPKLEELADHRSLLNAYVRQIHNPRQPLGLSAFELFGRVSQLTSRGLAQRTRCKLPSLVDTDQTTFDRWMRLLSRAADVEEVITHHDEHPWRGCKQSIRSLSIHDDVQHHLGILSKQFNRVSELFEQVVDRGLIAPVTVSNLSKVLRACTQALLAPSIPVAWFTAPAETAVAVLAFLRAQARRSVLASELGCLVDGFEDTFPVEIARTVNTGSADPTAVSIHGLRIQRSESVRDRLTETGLEIERLKPVSDSLDAMESVIAEQAGKAGLKIPGDARIKQLGQLGRAMHLAAAAGPARTPWIDSKVHKSIRTLTEQAQKYIGANEALVEQLGDVIASDQIPLISQILQEAGEKVVAVSQTLEEAPYDRVTLDETRSRLARGTKLIDEIVFAADQVVRGISIESPDKATRRLPAPTDKLLGSLQHLEEAGYFCGSWRDASVRQALCGACDDAIKDLADAASVRDVLSDRFSHRAFRESTRDLVGRGVVYSSILKRWFGGFRGFRAEIADIYNGDVPQGAAVAEDMKLLQKYHSRIRDVTAEAEHLKAHLPGDFLADEPLSWNQLKIAVTAIDQLALDWPEAVDSLSGEFHVVMPGTLTGPAAGLIAAVIEYNQLAAECNGDLPALSTGSASKIKEALADHGLKLEDCAELWNECEKFTLRPIPTVAELNILIASLTKFGKRQTELNAAGHKYASWLPEASDPTVATTWQAMQDGADAVELFLSAGTDPEELQAVWCNPTFNTRESIWATSGKHLEDAVKAAQMAVDSAGLDTSGLSFGEVADAIRQEIDTLVTEREALVAISEMLRDHEDIAIQELDVIAERVTEFQDVRAAIDRVNSQLDDLGVGEVTPNQEEAAQWLAEIAADCPVDPLTQAIASDETIRQQVSEALSEAKSVFSGPDFKESWSFLKDLFDLGTEISDGYVISETPIGALAEKLTWLSSQLSSLDIWLKFAAWKRDVVEAGFETVIDELIAQQYTTRDAADVVAVQFYRQLFDQLAQTDRVLGSFDIDEHERIRERFRFLDQWEVKASASQIRQYQLGREDRPSSSFLGADSSELGILQKEIAKKRKHKPLRRLFAEIPTVLQRLKPCIMMSPLSVSTFLDTDDIRFDLVIFDEASQVFPWDALGAIYRGKQLIIAGDEKQLPPTNFFNRADGESDEDDEDIGDYESILSLCRSVGMPNQRLKWHYRSRREPLIAFSNRHFYGGELVTFPSVYDVGGDGVRLEYVPDGRWSERKNQKEAERIVQMIVEHVRNKPDKSLGIIALNQSQQRAIEDTLYDLKRDRPEVDALFDGRHFFGDVDEYLFIKNLENVQGDERDVIFLSMGYGFNDTGKFNKNFGPINRQNGERRLNVAVTRAREELVFVSSVRAADMDLTSSKSEGAHLLKAYLNYAEKGVDTLNMANIAFAAEADSPFEEEVAAALIRRGLTPVPQVGCGGFRIDLALKHPHRPGEFCLAVECDGAAYHSSSTARDRDRIRQTILENLGWRIIRIWSTDWIRDPGRQIGRVMNEYQAAITMSPPGNVLTDDVEDEDGLEPQYVEGTSAIKSPALMYSNIDEVPSTVIESTAIYVLQRAGAMTSSDLIKQISRELGFRRLGGRIKARLEAHVSDDLETGRLKRLGERVTTGI